MLHITNVTGIILNKTVIRKETLIVAEILILISWDTKLLGELELIKPA